MAAVTGRMRPARRSLTGIALLAAALFAPSDAGAQARITAPELPSGTNCGGEVLLHAAAVETARQWRFRPAAREGRSVPAAAYLVFGFRSPVTVRAPHGGRS